MAEYRRGQGPNALPQGEATRLNEATPDELALESPDIPVIFAPGRDDPVPDDDSDLNEDLQILAAPPDPRYKGSVVPKERPGRIPKYVVRHLAEFRAAATAPDAPPSLRALFNATIRHLDDERRRGA